MDVLTVTSTLLSFNRIAARGVRRLLARLLFFHAWMVVVAFGMLASTQAQNIPPEYKLKAVFLYNFVQYVEWPTNAFAETNSPLIIGVLGKDPFGPVLDETVRGEVVKGRKLEIRRYQSVNEIKECHVLYISPVPEARMESIVAALKGRSILTVSEVENFTLRHGGMIRFVRDQNKIRFRINVTNANAAKLSVSSKLLQLADVVR